VGGSDLHIINSAPLRYLLSVPEGRPPTEASPVLIHLHGGDGYDPENLFITLTQYGPMNKEALSFTANLFIIAAPMLPKPGGDVWYEHAEEVRRFSGNVFWNSTSKYNLLQL
jgi:hypothetical protein